MFRFWRSFIFIILFIVFYGRCLLTFNGLSICHFLGKLEAKVFLIIRLDFRLLAWLIEKFISFLMEFGLLCVRFVIVVLILFLNQRCLCLDYPKIQNNGCQHSISYYFWLGWIVTILNTLKNFLVYSKLMYFYKIYDLAWKDL